MATILYLKNYEIEHREVLAIYQNDSALELKFSSEILTIRNVI